MVCCKGGTSEIDDDARWRTPVRRNLSCGQAKADSVDPDFVDPRTLPALPSLTRVRYNGEIEADEVACANAAIDADRMNRTIEVLGLNVEHLRLAREKHWNALSDGWQEHLEDPQAMREAARMELSSKEGSRLPRFFTTTRSYFAPVSEEILAEAPRAWI